MEKLNVEMGELKIEFKYVKQEMRSIFENLFNFLQKRVQLIKALISQENERDNEGYDDKASRKKYIFGEGSYFCK